MGSEYIVRLTIGPQPIDTTTLKSFLKSLDEKLSFKYTNIVADAGYESEERASFTNAVIAASKQS